jgi:hypothetical protein
MRFHLSEPPDGWRTFVNDIVIVVIGVLIALGAQQLVESYEWRAKVSRAEAAMRLELIDDNGPAGYGRLLVAPCLDQRITAIHDGAGHVPSDQLREWIAGYTPPFRSWDSEAWKAVVASDVGSHMGTERLVQWSAMYRITPSMTEAVEREAQLAADLREAVPPTGEIGPAEAATIRRTAGQLRLLSRCLVRGSALLLARSEKNGTAVRLPIQQALLNQARAVYGDCVQAPDPDAVPEGQQLRSNLTAGTVR